MRDAEACGEIELKVGSRGDVDVLALPLARISSALTGRKHASCSDEQGLKSLSTIERPPGEKAESGELLAGVE